MEKERESDLALGSEKPPGLASWGLESKAAARVLGSGRV
jgi:hypothetical protein